jgi:hypothetical protein
MKFKQGLILLGLTVILSACSVDVKDKDGGDSAAPVSASAPKDAGPLEATPAPRALSLHFPHDEKPNSYLVEIQIPDSVKVARRSGDDKVKSIEIPVTEGSQVIRDLSAQPGHHYLYELGQYAGGEFHKESSIEAQVPLDLVIDGKIQLVFVGGKYEAKGFERIFLMDHLVLQTMGQTLHLQGKTLISENAVIESFAPGTKAPLMQEGRSGGRIELDFEKATGRLEISLRGENGGDGKSGDPYGNVPPQGQSANFYGVPGMMCIEAPSPGGHDGSKGHRGADGRRGGNTGSAQLNILDISGFEMVTNLEPGHGGQGGAGGPGQPGGLGGYTCTGRAPSGLTGETGDHGENGVEGSPQPLCVTTAGQMNCK